jgi:hypothetical protein
MRSAWIAIALAVVITPVCGVAAEGASVTFQAGVNFGAFRSFALVDGQIYAKKPEIDNRLFRQRMADAIRAALVSKGLKEVAQNPDVMVTYQVSDGDYSEVNRGANLQVPGNGNRGGYMVPIPPAPVLYTEGTLIVDVSNASNTLVWRGTYRDRETKSPSLSRNLSVDARKLLAKYPPKSK